VQPPSYAVDLGESVRETEAHRLRQRQPGTAPPSVPGQQALATDSQGTQQNAFANDVSNGRLPDTLLLAPE